MPQGRKKNTIVKPTHPSHALLLVKIFLITLGRLPLLTLCFLLLLPYRILKILKMTLGLFLTILAYSIRIIVKKFLSARFWRAWQSRTRGRPKKFRLSKRTKIVLIVATFAIFIFTYTPLILTTAYQLPTPTKLVSPGSSLTTEFYDRNGNLLYRLYEGSNRTLVKLPEVPQVMIQATLAIEDQNFYHHIGIDPIAILRAFYHNLTQQTQEGASTLTQQLIKNSLLTPEKSYSRKIREMILALWAERIYSKDQILQMYFNEAPYGGSIMGIAAAAKTYFDKTPMELNLAESSYLAGLPASPTQFSPHGSNPQLAKIRQKEVLDRMAEEGFITKSEADLAFTKELKVRPLVNNILAPHFVFYIRDTLSEKFGTRLISQGGLKIYTTLDLKVQQQVEKIVKNEIDSLTSLDVKNGAAMVLEGETGQILAMVGSRDYHYPGFGNFNAALALRQPGSSIKPITYATALGKGFSPGSIILDTPVTFRDEWGNGYSPVNYDGRFHGPVTLRQALGSSLNIPAVKLLATVGVETVAQTAMDLGITTFDNPKRFGLALTLGAGETKMIEMMGLYGAFSQMGKLNKPTGILKVTDSAGNVFEDYEKSEKEVISSQIAYLVTNILADDDARKMAFGANSLLKIPGYEVAVKTGTSDNKRDNWTFGYTPKYVVGVWVGNPDNKPMNPSLTSGITGAAPIWNKIMHSLLDETQPLAFEKPGGLAEIQANGRKDYNIAGVIPKVMYRIQRNEDKLIFSDSFSTFSTNSAKPDQQADQSNPSQPTL